MKRLLTTALLGLGVFLMTGCTTDTTGNLGKLKLDFKTVEVYNEESTILVTPSFDDVSFYWNAIPKRDYEALGSDPEALKKEDMAFFNEEAAAAGITPAAIIGQKIRTGVTSENFRDLKRNTDYVIYGYGLSVDMKSGPVSIDYFKTDSKSLDLDAGLLRPQTKILPTAARMTQVEGDITPVDNTVRTFSQVVEDAELQSYATAYGSQVKGLARVYKETLAYTAELRGVSIRDVVSQVGKQGPYGVKYTYLKPETKYWLYVVVANEVGEIMDLDMQEITTTERVWAGGAKENFRIDISIPETYTDNMGTPENTTDDRILPGIGQQSVFTRMIPYVNGEVDDQDGEFNTTDPWVNEDGSQWLSAQVLLEDEYQRVSAGGDTQVFLEAAATEDNTFIKGGIAWENRFRRGMTEAIVGTAQQPLPSGAAMRFVAYAYNETYVSDLFQVQFETLPIQDPKDVTFRMMPTEEDPGEAGTRLGWGSIWARTAIIPSDALVPYHHHFMKKSNWDKYGDLKSRMEAAFNEYVDAWVVAGQGSYSRQTAIENLRRYSPLTYNEYSLEPDTDYVFWSGCFDMEGTLLSDNPGTLEIKTQPWAPKDVTVHVEPQGFFSGEDVLGSSERDFALLLLDNMSIEGSFDNGFGEWVITSLRDTRGLNYMDEVTYPDSWIVAQVYRGRRNNPQSYGSAPWAAPRVQKLDYTSNWVLVTICVDKYAEEFGQVTRTKIDTPTRDANGNCTSCRPYSEFPGQLVSQTRTAMNTMGVLDLEAPKPLEALKSAEGITRLATNGVTAMRRASTPADGTLRIGFTSDVKPVLPVSTEWMNVTAEERAKSQKVRFLNRLR